MKKHELLVPAGNMECLRQAVMNGCDAVYLACKSFGARKFANNFDSNEIIEAIHFCHLYGVKIYVTMNTLVKNNEVEDFLAQARFLHEQGVDALIVQDFGMICLLREMFPNLEIHASTQANISSKDVCELYHQLGVRRVVFSRELSIDEIDSIDVPIEKEAFIHGALCISYSGCCLMSSMLGGRSGNRGECAGVCRMPFSLYQGEKCLIKDKYLLSTKEFNTSSCFSRLLDSSIDSFKIEGRMKSPLYVGFITRLYRRLLDGESVDLKEEENKLKTIFNREFTIGRMFVANDKEFMNITSPNHVGLPIGKVISITKDKITIQLNPGMSLHQEDAIRFCNTQEGFVVNYLYDEKGKLISSSNTICMVDNKVSLKENDMVSKTQDFLLNKEFESLPKRKVPVTFSCIAKKEFPFVIEISDGKNHKSLEGKIVEESITSPIKREDIQRQLGKLGDTPFECDQYSIEMDSNIFISLREINEMRRELVQELLKIREEEKVPFEEREVSFEQEEQKNFDSICCLVTTQEQLEECIRLKVPKIISSIEGDSSIYYKVPRCIYSIKDSLKKKSFVSDMADYSGYDVIGNYSLNVMNIYTAYYLRKIGIYSVCLSSELSEEELISFQQMYQEKFGKEKFLVFSYGRVENMIIKGNILSLEKDQDDYSLVDARGRKFPCFYDGRLTHILHSEVFSHWKGKKIDACYFLSFYEEDKKQVEEIVKYYQSL